MLPLSCHREGGICPRLQSSSPFTSESPRIQILPWLHYRSVKSEMLGWDPRISMYSFLKIYLFTFLVMLGLCRSAGFFFPVAASRDYSLVVVCWLLIVVASLDFEHRL